MRILATFRDCRLGRALHEAGWNDAEDGFVGDADYLRSVIKAFHNPTLEPLRKESAARKAAYVARALGGPAGGAAAVEGSGGNDDTEMGEGGSGQEVDKYDAAAGARVGAVESMQLSVGRGFIPMQGVYISHELPKEIRKDYENQRKSSRTYETRIANIHGKTEEVKAKQEAEKAKQEAEKAKQEAEKAKQEADKARQEEAKARKAEIEFELVKFQAEQKGKAKAEEEAKAKAEEEAKAKAKAKAKENERAEEEGRVKDKAKGRENASKSSGRSMSSSQGAPCGPGGGGGRAFYIDVASPPSAHSSFGGQVVCPLPEKGTGGKVLSGTEDAGNLRGEMDVS